MNAASCRIGFRWALAAVLLLAGGVSHADPAADDPIAKCKALYLQRVTEYRQEYEALRADVFANYRKGLDSARNSARQNGDFDAVQTLDAEIARFEAKKDLPPISPAGSMQALARLVTVSRDRQGKAEIDRARKTVQLTDQYLQFLDQRVKQAVKADRLDQAKEIKAELASVRESPDYQAARFLLAEKQTPEAGARPDPVPAAADPKAGPAASNLPPVAIAYNGPGGQRIQARLDPKGLYDAVRAYEGAPAAEMATASSFRQLPANDTGKAPLAGGIGVTLDGALNSESAKYQLRIRLRSKTSDGVLQNLRVLVQYFARQTNNGNVLESPVTQFAWVPSVGSKSFTCEMKPADLPFATLYRYVGFNAASYREGSFVGAIVSVFSAEDKLLAQVTSSIGIKDRARTTFEMPATWLEGESDPPAARIPGFREHRRRIFR